jgi:hypothetical protein
MSAEDEPAPEIISAARSVVALQDSAHVPDDVNQTMQILLRAVKGVREYALAVAVDAAKTLDPTAKAAIARIFGAAELFRMRGGEEPTLARVAALMLGVASEGDIPHEQALKLEDEMTALGNQQEAKESWLN